MPVAEEGGGERGLTACLCVGICGAATKDRWTKSDELWFIKVMGPREQKCNRRRANRSSPVSKPGRKASQRRRAQNGAFMDDCEDNSISHRQQ